MGAIIRPSCKCAVHFKDLFIGSGKTDDIDVCKAPTACYSCGYLYAGNILDEVQKCPRCRKKVVPFGEIVISKEYLSAFFTWRIDIERHYKLENYNYKCPKCEEETLTFSKCGFWD